MWLWAWKSYQGENISWAFIWHCLINHWISFNRFSSLAVFSPPMGVVCCCPCPDISPVPLSLSAPLRPPPPTRQLYHWHWHRLQWHLGTCCRLWHMAQISVQQTRWPLCHFIQPPCSVSPLAFSVLCRSMQGKPGDLGLPCSMLLVVLCSFLSFPGEWRGRDSGIRASQE